MRIIRERVKDTARFVGEYNLFVWELIGKYQAAGKIERAFSLRLSLLIREVPKDTPLTVEMTGFKLTIIPKGTVILDCEDADLIPKFENFWRQYQGHQPSKSTTPADKLTPRER